MKLKIPTIAAESYIFRYSGPFRSTLEELSGPIKSIVTDAEELIICQVVCFKGK